ncbi:MAG: tRNA (adenosine(37)-N6)-dimethylallyltransferase MiaA [Bdellovibrionota bacterium]
MSALTGILTGPTASGKSALALELASLHGLEVVNADSLLVYRHMTIGTAKPTAQELASVPHHLIDIRNPDEPFTAADFVRETMRAIAEIHSRGRGALIVGGSGFYLKALLYGVWDAPATDAELRLALEQIPSPELYRELESRDAQTALRIGVNDRYRLVRAVEILRLSGKTPSELEALRPSEPDARFRLWVVDRDTEELYARISERTQAMLDAGLVEEASEVRAKFPHSRALGSVGYDQALAFLDGRRPQGRKIPEGAAGLRQEIELATRQLVKKQRTWFRSEGSARWFRLERERASLMEAAKEIYAK